MKRDPDDAIGKVLTGLRNAQASADLESRIMKVVERSARAQPAFSFSGWIDSLTHVRRPLAGGLALGGLLALTFALVSHSFTAYRRTQSAVHIASKAALNDVQSLHPPARSLLNSPAARTHTASTARMPVHNRSARCSSLRARSQPAPVAPLTQEERLLLRIAHTGDPVEMAMLNPEIRSRQAAETEAQFKQFVEQSKQGDQQ